MVTRTRFAASALVALIAFAAGCSVLLPGVAFWDTGELQTVGPLMGTAHPTGFPTYVLLGWFASVVLQPLGEPAFRMNLLSAICLAVAAGFAVDLVRALTGWLILGVAAGIGLALTPIAWAIGTHADAHSLHLALVAILLWLLVAWGTRVRGLGGTDRASTADDLASAADDRSDRYLVAAAIVFGLAMGNHSLTLLLVIPVGLYVLAIDPGIWRRGRLVLACVMALAITVVLVYLELPLRSAPDLFRAPLVYGTPSTWDGFRYIVLAEQFQGGLDNPFGELPRKFAELIARTVTQFGILAPLVPVAFIVTSLRNPRYALLTGTAAAVTCFFAASYVNADINRYYLGPALMAWTWLAILAGTVIAWLSGPAGERPEIPHEPSERDRPAADPARSAAAGHSLARSGAALAFLLAIALLVPTIIALPARAAQVDQRRGMDASTWTTHVLDTLEPDAVIVSWWSYSTPLWYAHLVLGERPDITIIDDRTRLDENLGGLTDVIDANLGKRPVYVIRADRNEVALLASRYELDYIDGVDASALTKVIRRRAGG
ncbi:MAG: DUF2723 domain-containing protein [Chloroflexota bacterium]